MITIEALNVSQSKHQNIQAASNFHQTFLLMKLLNKEAPGAKPNREKGGGVSKRQIENEPQSNTF